MDLEIEVETASEESGNEISESERVKQVLLRVDGWVTKPRHTHLLKRQGHNLTFCQMHSLWIILVFFFND
jgi:hypothetical protein